MKSEVTSFIDKYIKECNKSNVSQIDSLVGLVSNSNVKDRMLKILCQNKKLTPFLFEPLASTISLFSKSISHIDLSFNPSYGDKGYVILDTFLSRLKNLEYLNLENTGLKDISGFLICKRLKEMNNLKTLILSSNYLSGQFIMMLSNIIERKLESLVRLELKDLNINEFHASELLRVVFNYSQLESVNLDQNKLTNKNAEYIINSFTKRKTKLKEISIQENFISSNLMNEINSFMKNKDISKINERVIFKEKFIQNCMNSNLVHRNDSKNQNISSVIDSSEEEINDVKNFSKYIISKSMIHRNSVLDMKHDIGKNMIKHNQIKEEVSPLIHKIKIKDLNKSYLTPKAIQNNIKNRINNSIIEENNEKEKSLNSFDEEKISICNLKLLLSQSCEQILAYFTSLNTDSFETASKICDENDIDLAISSLNPVNSLFYQLKSILDKIKYKEKLIDMNRSKENEEYESKQFIRNLIQANLP